MFNSLIELYSDPDVVTNAVVAHRADAASSVNIHRKELEAIDADLRKTEAAAERYMAAFENGTVTEEMFGDRVRDLGQKAAALRARRDVLVAMLDETAGGRAADGRRRRSAPQPARDRG